MQQVWDFNHCGQAKKKKVLVFAGWYCKTVMYIIENTIYIKCCIIFCLSSHRLLYTLPCSLVCSVREHLWLLKGWKTTICILKQESVMVVSGQMVTFDSPGSALMKWTTLKLHQAEIKHLKFFLSIPPPPPPVPAFCWKLIKGVN